jgi:HlyD family secretion protein
VEHITGAPERRLSTRCAAALALVLPALACCCGDEGSELLLVGTVERTLVELVAPASEQILQIAPERGQRVAQGDLLVQLDATLALADLASAEAEVARARSASRVATHDADRVRKLRAGGVVSEQELERAELAQEEADAQWRAAGAHLVAAQKRFNDLAIVSPVDGVVDQIPFDEGERVPAGSVVAVVLADGAPWVHVWLPERDHVRVGPGTPAEVRVDGLTHPLRGRVLDVSREPEFTPHYALTERERVHLVYETRVAIEDAPADLRPGTPAEVWIDRSAPDGGDAP